MSRDVPEWIGKDDDAKIPPRVKDRVAQRAGDCCQTCSREIGGRLRAEFDHIIPLILGGKNREANLQLLCNECHGAKTKRDVKIKAKVARVRRRQKLGIKRPSQFACSTSSPWKKKVGGEVVRR